ncbi:MAG: hypothetical protein ACM34A_01715 [Bacillota bacterium]
MNKAVVYRKILKSPAEFREFLHSIERPKFAITDFDSKSEFLQQHEWIFSNDMHLLMRAVLGWDKRGCSLAYQEAYEEYDGSWRVIDLPDYFNDAAAALQIVPANGNSKTDDAIRAFFNEVWRDAYSYGFFTLEAESYDGYLDDWNEEYGNRLNMSDGP